MAAGDFSAAQLYPIIVSANAMWQDPRYKTDMYTPVEAVKAIAENQKIELNPVLTNGACTGYKVAWLKRCGVDAVDCSSTAASSSCDLTGPELEAVQKTYTVTGCVSDSFTVWDDDCNGLISYEEKIQKGQMECIKNIEKVINTAAVGFLNANDFNNTYAISGATNHANGTYFGSAEWTPDIIAKFAEIAIMNRYNNPIFVTGSNLFGTQFNARYNFADLDKKSQLGKLNHFPNWYFDLETVDSTIGTKSTLMFDPGAVGFFSKAEFTNLAPQARGDKNQTLTYSIPSMNISYKNGSRSTPLTFDVYSQPVCKTAAKGIMRWGRVWKIMAQYQFVLSPEDCNNNTGIIKFINGVAPS